MTNNTKEQEFYVGYADRAPEGIGRFVRSVVLGLLGLVCLVALGLVAWQRPFARSEFRFGQVETFDGFIDPKPWPALVLADGTSMWLVGQGKHGFTEPATGRVRASGSLILRDGLRMLEVATITALPGQAGAITDVPLGVETVTGELVDTKCYLGVMNPGQGLLHKDCARRCLRGGVPAAMVSNGRVLFIDGPFDITATTLHGQILKRGERLILRVE